MDLTAIIACKDRFHNLEYCIKSISTSKSIPQVILVDFGSKRALSYLAQKYSWLSVIKVTNNISMFHKSRALNIGIRAAKTKFVCLTDIDQLFQPNFFDVVMQELRNKNSFVRCTTHFLPSMPAKMQPTNINRSTYFKLLKLVTKTAVKKPHGEGCCHGVSKDLLLKINGYDEAYIGWGFEDKDLALRLRGVGAQIVWISKKTSMIHMPHSRDKAYFAPKVRDKNERLYRRKLSKLSLVLVANKRKECGKL